MNIVVCIYSIAQAFGEIRRLVSPRFLFRSTSSYYFSLFLDQAKPQRLILHLKCAIPKQGKQRCFRCLTI